MVPIAARKSGRSHADPSPLTLSSFPARPLLNVREVTLWRGAARRGNRIVGPPSARSGNWPQLALFSSIASKAPDTRQNDIPPPKAFIVRWISVAHSQRDKCNFLVFDINGRGERQARRARGLENWP